MAGLAEIITTTYEKRDKKVHDFVQDNNPLTYLLKRKGNVKIISGGRSFTVPVRLAPNAYVQRIDPAEEIAMGRNDTLNYLEYTPKIIVVPIIMNWLERLQNAGPEQFLDLLDQRMDVAESSLMNEFEADMQGDGTGYGGKAFAGIRSYISKTPALGSYGGLSRVTYTGLRNLAVDAVATFGSSTDSSNIESRYRYMSIALERNGGPEYVFAGTTHFAAAADAMSAKGRFTRDETLYKANFKNVEVEGMTVILAGGRQFSSLNRIAADSSYFMRMDDFELYMYRGANFQPLDKRIAFNQLVDASIIAGVGQLVSGGTGLSGVMYDS